MVQPLSRMSGRRSQTVGGRLRVAIVSAAARDENSAPSEEIVAQHRHEHIGSRREGVRDARAEDCYRGFVRIAVLSDIHANPIALEAVLDDAERASVTNHLVLGDIVDLGPDPGQVVDRVRRLACPAVGGNHDRLDELSKVPALEAIRIWSQMALSSSQRAWLESLPDELDIVLEGCRIRAVHASPGSRSHPISVSTRDEEIARWFGPEACHVLCCGHTHIQLLRRLGARTVVNVGSVGMPFSSQHVGGQPTIFPWAEYAILDIGPHGTAFELRRVSYDFSRFEQRFRECGFEDAETLLSAWTR
jgi:predicted phosphodiesterase